MRYGIASFAAAMVLVASVAAQDTPTPAQRGALAVRGQPEMNPALWSIRAFDTLWKRWGLAEKPADFAQQLQERYGLQAAAYANGELPMGLHHTRGALGKGIVNDCLLCHAGRVAGQTVIGLGNASLDLNGLFNDLYAGENRDGKAWPGLRCSEGPVCACSRPRYLAPLQTGHSGLR